MTDHLNLIIGKPNLGADEKIATFTRFVLPFAFQLQSAESPPNPPDLFYILNNKTDLSFIKRRKYFTRETSDTLYERGQWLSICDTWNQTSWGKAKVTVILRDRPFKIGMLPPQIVLFETPEIKEQQKENILQTGFLYVDVYFPDQQENPPQLDDLLVLNEFFRYFGIPFDKHAETFNKLFSEVPVKAQGNEKIGSLNELERYFERWAAMLELPIKYNNQFYQLFPTSWAKAARDWMYNEPGSHEPEHWQIYADNRCYVWTVAFLANGGDALRTDFEPNNAMLSAKDYGHWIKLVNVDNPPFDWATQKYKNSTDTHKSVTPFEREWAEQRTYKRWEDDGTWYGYSYHSTAILARPFSYVFAPSASYYFDATVMLLYIRMTLFRFGRALSKAVPDNDDQNNKETMKKWRKLRYEFTKFTVLYRFPMLSNQQQHMELYEINRKSLDIEQFFEEIRQEVDNTHEFLELVDSNSLATAANQLTIWGVPLATGGLVTALFGMSDFHILQCVPLSNNCSVNWDLLFQASIAVFSGFAVWLRLSKKKRRKS
ncbi:magnesium transporter CorA family protein [Methylobacter tundripaludum]|uniref:hypothetical protein n=1 Tax=Methylobacter tundripaludum TaxID=173365 RepID=UPI0004DFCA33|nr:hypothetical protein [Methylobacter tundripaludum]